MTHDSHLEDPASNDTKGEEYEPDPDQLHDKMKEDLP